jgi:hypothetical protein
MYRYTVQQKYSILYVSSNLNGECFSEFWQETYFELSVVSWFIMSRNILFNCGIDYGLDDRGSIPDRGRGFFF